MSPDERAFSVVVDRALRRARVLAVCEAAASGAGAAAVSPIAAVLVAALVAVLRLRHWSRAAIVRALERATPSSRNVLFAASEIRDGRILATARVQERVFADAAKVAAVADVGLAAPAKPLVFSALGAAFVWAIAVGAGRVDVPIVRNAIGPSNRSADRAASMTIAVTTRPPAYTGLPESHATDPAELRAVEGSVAVMTIDAAGARISVEHDGATRTLSRDADGRFTDRLPLTKTGYVSIASDSGIRRTMPIVVSPDALPAVRIVAPGRDLVFKGGNASVVFSVHATDDYGVTSLALRCTKVSGSGEEYEFVDGEIPLSISRANARDWTATASKTVAELGLQEGDMLVYRAVATDARAGGGTAESDAYFIEISRLGVAAGDAFTLPEQETRYALSQQMLIVKTDRLAKQRTAMTAEQFTETSMNLAVEQRMIRAEFVFMLGGEIEDEEVEAEQSVELQAGRLANRGQRDLRAATVAMSQAEKLLTSANPSDALGAERDAVAALQRAFARDRYILRASPMRTDLDPKRRLTGNLAGAAGWVRQIPDTPENRRAAQLQDVLRGVSELSAIRDQARTQVLALQILRVAAQGEPGQSSALRNAATALQNGRVDEAIAAVAAETSRVMGAQPVGIVDVAPGLRRALAERPR